MVHERRANAMLRVGAAISTGAMLLGIDNTSVHSSEQTNNFSSEFETSEYRLFDYKWEKNDLGITSDIPELDQFANEALGKWAEVSGVRQIEGEDMTVSLIDEKPGDWASNFIAGARIKYVGNVIVGCEIEILREVYNNRLLKDRKKLLLHEIGHCLGIDHSEKYSVVNHLAIQAEKLTEDDIEAIQALYGPPEPPEPEFPQDLLKPGWNLVTWGMSDISAEKCECEAVYHWVPESGFWERWGKGLPRKANTLNSLKEGEVYWIEK